MKQLNHVVLELPRAAFICNYRKLQISIGDSWEKIHNFFLDTRANYTDVRPSQTGRHPQCYHFSAIPCTSDKFKTTDIITVEMEKDKVIKILRRKPFEIEKKEEKKGG